MHKRIKEKLILFIDKSLSEEDFKEVSEHLKDCPSCSEDLQRIKEIWNLKTPLGPVSPSARLWPGILRKIENRKNSKFRFLNIPGQLAYYSACSLSAVLFFTGVLLGNYLGSPDLKGEEQKNNQIAITEEDRFFNSISIDYFSDIPPESVAGLSILLKLEE